VSIENVKLKLKQKYSLVHVPAERKVEQWLKKVRSYIGDGQPAEQAGLRAAKEVFPYEYKEHRVYEEVTVQELLNGGRGVNF
jgi:hypothetical protein